MSKPKSQTAELREAITKLLDEFDTAVSGMPPHWEKSSHRIALEQPSIEAFVQLITKTVAEAERAARIDELERITKPKTSLDDIYGNDPRNNYGYSELQVRDAVNWLKRRHYDRINQLKEEHEK